MTNHIQIHGVVVTDDGRPAGDVAVSLGASVTTTDAAGRFSLERQPAWGNFVVLSRPSGFSADPWWYRVPERADPAPMELQFVLVAQQQALPYEFVHLSDPHLTTLDAVGSAARHSSLYPEGSLPAQITTFLDELAQLAPNAQSVMITGDLVDDGLVEQFQAFMRVIASSRLPVHLIPGNHDHMVDELPGGLISANDYLTNAGTPDRYEQWIGPRWYSFDVAGLHVVAMDWHTHEVGIDHEIQNAWVKADLGRLEPGTPYLLLFHDQPGRSLLDQLPWPPVAALSGHWHTSRVVEVDGSLHVNSLPTFFAGLDYSPPAYRVVTWDGERITLRTHAYVHGDAPAALTDVGAATFAPVRSRSKDPSLLWQASSVGAGHRQPVAIHGGTVFVGTQIEDRPAGWVEAFELMTGELRWRTATAASVKTSPAAADGLVVAAEVSGDLVALDAATGELRWRLASSDPYRRFAWGAPTIANGVVYVGDQCDLRAVDLQSGERLWCRTDLSPHHNLATHAAPLIVGELVIVGFWPTPTDPVGLDVRTGQDVWGRSELDPLNPQAALKTLLIMGTATYDADRDAIVMPAHGHTTVLDRATGARRWVAGHEGRFSPATPLVTEAGYLTTISGHGIRMLYPENGSTLWDVPITGDAPFAMAAYAKLPHPVIAPPILHDDQLLIPGLDGTIRRFNLAGDELGRTQLASAIAAPLTLAGDRVVAVATDGSVLCLDAHTVAPAGS